MASINPNTGMYVPLKTIVAYFLDEYNKSDGDQDQAWILGFRALTKLNQQIAAEPKTVRLPLLPNKTVQIPSDCISWSKIGLLNTHGEVVTLKINNGLTTFRDNNPNRLEDLTPNINDSVVALGGTPLFLNYFYNDGYYNLFGLGGGLIQYGECRVDERNGVILMPADFKYRDIIFEYISSPERDGDYVVPTVLTEAIIAFIAWKMKLAPREIFYAEAVEARRSLPKKRATLQEINQVIRESESMKLRS